MIIAVQDKQLSHNKGKATFWLFWHMCPNKDSNQPAHPGSLISLCCLHEKTAFLAIENVPSEVSDKTGNVQADLNLHWVHMSEVTFSDVTAHFTWIVFSGKKNVFCCSCNWGCGRAKLCEENSIHFCKSLSQFLNNYYVYSHLSWWLMYPSSLMRVQTVWHHFTCMTMTVTWKIGDRWFYRVLHDS